MAKWKPLQAVISVVLFAGLGRFSLAEVGKPEMAALEQGIPGDVSPPALLDEILVVRIYFDDPQRVAELAAWKEPWEVNDEQGYLVTDVTPAEYNLLVSQGFRLEVDEALSELYRYPRPSAASQTEGIPGFPCYRTVEETFAAAQQLADDYPQLATWTDVGDTWEKTQGMGGYDMKVLRLTNSAMPGPKPKLFIMSGLHAREYAPPELSTRFAEYLLANYNLDPDITWLLDYQEIHLLLHSNPDGRKQAETGLLWRKNTNNNFCSDTIYRGVDLNRNFEFQWGCCGGFSTDACSEVFLGPSPASEPEVQAIQDYLLTEFPDQRGSGSNDPAPVDATGLFLDIHAYGELVLWPWGFPDTPAPNDAALQTLARKLAYFNGYYPEPAIDLYPADGTSDNFAYGELGLAAYTIELGTTFFQGCDYFEDAILPDNLPALVYAAKVSRAPYALPSGPDVSDLSLSAEVVPVGQAITLTVTANDTLYSDQNGSESVQDIVAVEAYVDLPAWITTTVPLSFSLNALDGGYDSSVETAGGSLDTEGLSVGRHTLFVRARDADGNWGPFSAIFFSLTDPTLIHKFYLPMLLR